MTTDYAESREGNKFFCFCDICYCRVYLHSLNVDSIKFILEFVVFFRKDKIAS